MSILSQQKQSQAPDFPNVRPSLDLRFALAKKLDPRITFTRGSTGTYFGPDGLMKTAGVNEPRFDHDPITGQSLGLLIEESRVNQMVRSDIEGTVGAQPTGMFLAGPINGQTAVVSTDVFLGPNGQSCKHTRGAYTDNNIGYMDSGGVTAGSTYVFSAYVYIPSSQAKNFEGKLLRFSMESPNSSNTFASADVTIVDRWQRVWGTCVPTGVNAVWVLRTTANAGSFFYTDCWQLELGSFPTSYMPASGGSQFTRTADLASMTGTNFSSWYNQTEGTFYISTYKQTSPFAAGRRVMEISDGTNNNRTEMGYHTNGPYIFSTYSGITQYQTYPITTFPTTTRQAFSYSQLVNNLTYITSLSSSVSLYNKFLKPSYSILGIGRATAAGTNQFGGTISRLTYYPIQLTNQQLINLTL